MRWTDWGGGSMLQTCAVPVPDESMDLSMGMGCGEPLKAVSSHNMIRSIRSKSNAFTAWLGRAGEQGALRMTLGCLVWAGRGAALSLPKREEDVGAVTLGRKEKMGSNGPSRDTQ